MVINVIKNYVVTLITFGEILFGVINDVICADGADKIDIAGAANSRDLSAERFGDLYGECPNTSGRAVDQDLLPRLPPKLQRPLVQTSH